MNRCLVKSGRKHRHVPLVFLIEIRKFNFPDFPLTFYRCISSTFGSLKWTNQATWDILRREKWQVLKGKANLSHCDLKRAHLFVPLCHFKDLMFLKILTSIFSQNIAGSVLMSKSVTLHNGSTNLLTLKCIYCLFGEHKSRGGFSRHVQWWALHLEPESMTQSNNPVQFFILPGVKLLSPRKLCSQEKAVLTGRRETPAEPGTHRMFPTTVLQDSLKRPISFRHPISSNMKECPLATMMTVRWVCSRVCPRGWSSSFSFSRLMLLHVTKL